MFALTWKKTVCSAILSLLCFIAVLANATPFDFSADESLIYVIPINGPIGPATVALVEDSMAKANARNASLVVLQIDTPGGLGSSMRAIIDEVLASQMPVVGYVAPHGARAASAGTFIMYACHLAAMAPGTHIGAASPVKMRFPGQPSSESQQQQGRSAAKKKALNSAVAYIRSLATMRDRNAQWAEQAVTKASTLTVNEALKRDVIDIKANTVNALVKQLNQQTVRLDDEPVRLNTQNYQLVKIQPDWKNRFLQLITNPTVAYLLLLIGIYGIFFEFLNPGFIVPGVVGAIALITGLYALQLLPISFAGLGLIVLGVSFIISEMFVPSFGVLGLGGTIALVVGSIMLIDTDVPGFAMPIETSFTVSILFAALFFGIVQLILRAHKKPVETGLEHLIGAKGYVQYDYHGKPWVHAAGDRWQVKTTATLKEGDYVQVTDVEGLTVKINVLEHKEA